MTDRTDQDGREEAGPQDAGPKEAGPEGAGPEEAGPEEAGPDEVGTVAQEAAKLFEALRDWAKDGTAEQGAAARSTLGAVGARLSEVDEHFATGGRDCSYCPVCQAIQVVRQASPEVRSHLAVAGSSLLQAAAGLLEQLGRPPTGATPDSGVHHIDIEDESSDAGGWDSD